MGSRHIVRRTVVLSRVARWMMIFSLGVGGLGTLPFGWGQSSTPVGAAGPDSVKGAAASSGQRAGRDDVFVVQSEHIQHLPPFKHTDVRLDTVKLTPRGHRELITAFTAEQGFARRSLPLDPKGLMLRANGAIRPEGLDYEEMLQRKGISAKPGDRLVISDIKIEATRVVFEFNGGPDRKHKYLRHVEIGAAGGSVPLTQDDGQDPVGSRLTLVFDKYVPEMTADQMRALIQPVIDFSVKTPIEAYTDTLPPKLKEAILGHHVLVGMDRKMVVYALGAPVKKIREEKDGQPFEEWIYGEAPEVTEFVRFQNNRVVQVETSPVGADIVVRNQDETDGYLGKTDTREVSLGDAKPSAEGEIRRAPPSLRLPGEDLPGQPQPIQVPTSNPRPQPVPVPHEIASPAPSLSAPTTAASAPSPSH